MKMLFGDRGKFLGIIAGITFGALLIAQQSAIFCGLMIRTYSEIKDIQGANLWVMDPSVKYIDEFKPLPENDLHRVRGVAGVEWAVRFYKGLSRARMREGNYQQVIVHGLDDDTLIGAPSEMLMGTTEDLHKPDAVIVDDAGYRQLWPGEPFALGQVFEMNDQRAVLVGICKASRIFQTIPLIITRYSKAMQFSPQERRTLTFILAKSKDDVAPKEVCRNITTQTRLMALTRQQFAWKTMAYLLEYTGIPLNFAVTVLMGFLVGSAIAGQTFYMFTLDNLKQFGALKAMGTTNRRLVGMILAQAAVSGFIGFGLGIGPTAVFGESIKNAPRLAFYMPWEVLVGTAIAVILMLLTSSILSIRRVLALEPAVVFQT